MSKSLRAVIVPLTLAFAGIFGPFFSASAAENRTKDISGDRSPGSQRSHLPKTVGVHPPDAVSQRLRALLPHLCEGYSRLYQRGVASWYGPGFQGRKMANGRTYDMHAYTVAHKTLPLGTPVCVVNKKNGAIVHAVVTDRGPYIGNRVIDLSKRVAHELGVLHQGLAEVHILVPAYNS
ncbi:MAG TPA: septal ring lytic transglycosylase RlpA family protein [Candidatus Paceibacterota bacterium]|nr:septal ring lytic transglycosylase RlpA family protein [Candidatus Paceibacterota bacterium]